MALGGPRGVLLGESPTVVGIVGVFGVVAWVTKPPGLPSGREYALKHVPWAVSVSSVA